MIRRKYIRYTTSDEPAQKKSAWHYFFVIVLMMLFTVTAMSMQGCAYDHASAQRMDTINRDYNAFVAECKFMEGFLWIDRPFTERRVQNAPVTVWEKQDAVCSIPGGGHVRMYE